MPLTSFAAFIYDGVYVGVTETATMRNIMIVTILVIFIPLLFTLKHYAGNQGMWVALTIMMIARGAGLGMFLKSKVLR